MSTGVRLLALFAALEGAIAEEWQLIGADKECKGQGERSLNGDRFFSIEQCKSECLSKPDCEYIAYSSGLASCKWQFTSACQEGLQSVRSGYNTYQLVSRSGGSPSGTSSPGTGTSAPGTVISKLDECWKPVAVCDKPAFDMEECAAATYTLSQTDSKSWEVCAGAEVGADAYGISATVKTEICGSREGSEEIGRELEVKVPGQEGRVTVACAKGVTVKVGGKNYLRMTIERTSVYDKCPTPACPSDLDDVKPNAKDPLTGSGANRHFLSKYGVAVAVVTCLTALLR